jgi:hypothetical protein
MINRFKSIFGKPDETIVCVGDWEQRKHRKYKEPIKGKGFRTLFRRNGYKVYLVDEFRTSCRCSKCNGGNCEKFRKCRNPKPMKNNDIISHGLLMCKTCNGLWNRDENSSRNIYKIAYNAINKKERPNYLCRSKKVVSGTTSSSVDRLQCQLSLDNLHVNNYVVAPKCVARRCPETGNLLVFFEIFLSHFKTSRV